MAEEYSVKVSHGREYSEKISPSEFKMAAIHFFPIFVLFYWKKGKMKLSFHSNVSEYHIYHHSGRHFEKYPPQASPLGDIFQNVSPHDDKCVIHLLLVEQLIISTLSSQNCIHPAGSSANLDCG